MMSVRFLAREGLRFVGRRQGLTPQMGKIHCKLCRFKLNLHTTTVASGSMKNKTVAKPIVKKESSIQIWKNMTVNEFSAAVNRNLDDVFEAIMLTENADSYDNKLSRMEDLKVIQNIAKRLGVRCRIIQTPAALNLEAVFENKDIARRPPPDPKDMIKRSPVVTIMGHVDHGKTTLLDSLRNTSVVKDEFGGITQHIGAFSVKVPNGESITFLDTPGHAAFAAMRARGAHATDIVVLVVAADDGVMEQTIQSIHFAKEAKVPIIVAINKIDKHQIDLEHTVKSLLANGVILEEVGGDVQSVKISALKALNLNELTDAILALSEVLEIKGDPKGLVEGVCLESKNEAGRGKLATVLIQRGTLKKGAYIVAGTAWAKIRAMFDEWGKPLSETGPGMPAQVIGWRELPGAGEDILGVETERKAKEVVEWRLAEIAKQKTEEQKPEIDRKLQEHLVKYQEDLERRRASGILRRRRRKYEPKEKEFKEDLHPRFNVVVKGDVDGSVEAILDIIETYERHHECRFDVIHYGVGNITQNDIELAEAFDGTIYAFNVKAPADVTKLAQSAKVEMKEYKVIYKMVDDFKAQISSKLPLLELEVPLGEANFLQEFLVTEGKKKVPVAGCRCTKGMLKKSALFKVIRNEQEIHKGTLSSMKHVKSEVDSIKKDVECGLMLSDISVRFQPGDTLICYETKKESQKTKWNPGF